MGLFSAEKCDFGHLHRKTSNLTGKTPWTNYTDVIYIQMYHSHNFTVHHNLLRGQTGDNLGHKIGFLTISAQKHQENAKISQLDK